jgi:hypothetical protein
MKVFKLFRKVRGKDKWVRNPKLVAAEKAAEQVQKPVFAKGQKFGPVVTKIKLSF